MDGMQEVIGSTPLSSTCSKLLLNRDLRYLTTFVSAVKYLFQSWKNFHEMIRSPRTWHENPMFSPRIFGTSRLAKPAFASVDAIIFSANMVRNLRESPMVNGLRLTTMRRGRRQAGRHCGGASGGVAVGA